MAFTQMNAGLIPAPDMMMQTTNYLDFTSGAGNDFGQQYLPELYEQEVERFGNRTLSGFLRMVGAEMPMTSDQVIWSEQNRLHISYSGCTMGAVNDETITIPNIARTLPDGTVYPQAIRPGATIVVTEPISGTSVTALVDPDATQVAGSLEAFPYVGDPATGDWPAAFANATVNIFVYGSEFIKGSDTMAGSVQPQFTQFHNKPIIIKDHFEINGSDTAQIGWVEVAAEDGTSGYLWYLKSEAETRLRFDDYLEMAMIEGDLAAAAAGINADQRYFSSAGTGSSAVTGGTQGLFSAINDRGNVWQGFAGAAAPGAGALADFDAILSQLDAQGAIEENMLFLDRGTALDFDDMIGAMAGGGYAAATAASYGLFENGEEMALNFGFSGFRRGSYDFYKTDWKYLNDASTRGMASDVQGVLVPAGTSTVYDQQLGQNIRRPFLHVRYRASQTEDRRYKTWITGSVGGAYTDGFDMMRVNFLSERCLCVQAANNFVEFIA